MQMAGGNNGRNGGLLNSSTGFRFVHPVTGTGPGDSLRPGRRGDYRLLSMKAVSCDLDTAPTLVASTSPPLNSISVGMPRIP